MRSIKTEAFLWVEIVVFLAVWVIILVATGTDLKINIEAVKKLPDAMTAFIIVRFVFTKWLWRLRIFNGWLVPFPDLQGTWEGTVSSTWKNPTTGIGIEPIAIVIVIRQTFSSIHCTLFSKESDSFSTVAQITVEEDSKAIYVNYNYANHPRATLRERSQIHDGAAKLRVIGEPERRLEGEFWTSRCTAGDIRVRFSSKKLVEKFPSYD
jgi:SMODS-associating 2TM, beta-strand rich effector domain